MRRPSSGVRATWLLWLGLALACASSRAGSNGGGPAPAEPTATGVAFENPGGMWMPVQMGEQAATLRKLGLGFDPAALGDPTAFPLGAVVSLGGCSASFVSPEGLIITNHHCVTGALQYNSTPEQNLLQEGFLARTRGDERWAGPTARVYVTTGFQDVTEQVVRGTAEIADDKARADEIAKRRKDLVSACESDRPEVRCQVASYFEGAQFFRIEQLELRDVRLVYAPHAGIGVFGGEVDNWRWPRHTGDFAFFRAYVDAQQEPADHAAANVPYRPPHHLAVTKTPLREGDLVMVAGYPGRTTRFRTADEVRDAVEWFYPRSIRRIEETIATLEALTKSDPELAIKAASSLRGLHNSLTNFRGQLEGLSKGGLAAQKAEQEKQLRAWIAADPGRSKQYGQVLDEIARLNAEHRQTRDTDAAFGEIAGASTLLEWASTALAVAKERKKPDAERKAGLQERDWPRARERLQASAKRYDRRLDRARLELALRRAAELPAERRPALYGLIVPDGKTDAASISAAVDRLYARTKLEKVDVVLGLVDKATPEKLRKHPDPFVKLAVAAEPMFEASEERDARFAGAMASLRPRYVAALRELGGGTLAPDANGTLRITYGTVRGYRPAPEKPVYRPFTVVSEMVAKHTGADPFMAPQSVLDAAKAKKFGPYAAEQLGEVPIDFLADLDITGGNSGSATLNAAGELVGLVFDGNYEAMASDWMFMPDITRSIHVDIRYVQWVMDAVDGADHLLQEMGLTPAL